MAVCGASNSVGGCANNDCFQVVRTNKTVTVPCTTNVREKYIVNVPKKKAYTVNKQVPYTDYEDRVKPVPYQYVDHQTVMRSVPVCRVVPQTRRVCTKVPVKNRLPFFPDSRRTVTKKCPRTTYVRRQFCEPRPYFQAVQKTGWKNGTEKTPVQKIRNQQITEYMTTVEPEERYRWKQQTQYVKKTLPVFNVLPKTPKPCGSEGVVRQDASFVPQRQNFVENVSQNFTDRSGFSNAGTVGHLKEATAYDQWGNKKLTSGFHRINKHKNGKLKSVFDKADCNKDGVLSFYEYATARKNGYLQDTAAASLGYGYGYG